MNKLSSKDEFGRNTDKGVSFAQISQRFQELYSINIKDTENDCDSISKREDRNHDLGGRITTSGGLSKGLLFFVDDLRNGDFGDHGYNEVRNVEPLFRRAVDVIRKVRDECLERYPNDDPGLKLQEQYLERAIEAAAQIHPNGRILSLEEVSAKKAASADASATFGQKSSGDIAVPDADIPETVRTIAAE